MNSCVLRVKVNIVIPLNQPTENGFIANAGQVLRGLRTWSSSALTKPTVLQVTSLISMKTDEARCYNHKQCHYRAHPQQSALWCHSSWVWCQTPCHRTSNIFTAQIQNVILSSCVECRLTFRGLLLCQLPLVFTVHWLLLQTGTATALRTHSTQAQHTIHSHSEVLRTRFWESKASVNGPYQRFKMAKAGEVLGLKAGKIWQ